jgi:hypothetical protein
LFSEKWSKTVAPQKTRISGEPRTTQLSGNTQQLTENNKGRNVNNKKKYNSTLHSEPNIPEANPQKLRPAERKQNYTLTYIFWSILHPKSTSIL